MKTNLSFVCLFLLLSIQLNAAILCSDAVQGKTLKSTDRVVSDTVGNNFQIVTAGGVMVTGGHHYPLPVILQHLKLDHAQIGNLRGKTILSVAEGFSDLLPHLLRSGADAWAVDLIYGSKDIPDSAYGPTIKNYIKNWGDRLVPGDAVALPIESSSVDVLLSHKFVNNISKMKSLLFVKEAIRVLKPGGEARIFGFSDRAEDGAGFSDATIQSAQEYIQSSYGNSVQVEVKKEVIRYSQNRKPHDYTFYLLIIRKPRS